jgi:hypothetical protein
MSTWTTWYLGRVHYCLRFSISSTDINTESTDPVLQTRVVIRDMDLIDAYRCYNARLQGFKELRRQYVDYQEWIGVTPMTTRSLSSDLFVSSLVDIQPAYTVFKI